jgi:hypothetical protein
MEGEGTSRAPERGEVRIKINQKYIMNLEL